MVSKNNDNHRNVKRKNGFQPTSFSWIFHMSLFTFISGSFQPIIYGSEIGQPQYAIVYDSGSTGSRVLAYSFHTRDGRLVLHDEFFAKTEPGLSSYHAEPQKGAKSIEYLLEKAKAFVPQRFWSKTPLVLKATAGLRLLETTEADNLLKAVRDTFLRSGFLVKDNSVEIMSGLDEAIYSWFAINILTDRLAKTNSTLAALDLGGASTQVTFPIKDSNKISSLADHLHTVSTSKETIDVFSTSYLNLGLQAVRHAVLTSGKTKDKINYVSECVHPKFASEAFTYASKTVYITGKDNLNTIDGQPAVKYDTCLKLVKKKIIPLVNPKPLALKLNEVAAFSYFYGAAMETGIIGKSGESITVGHFIEKAKVVCATAPNPAEPFMCLDLIYISVLLNDAYGLDEKTEIKLYRTVDGHQVTWALGCAYNLLDGMTRTKKDSDSDSPTSANRWRSLFQKVRKLL